MGRKAVTPELYEALVAAFRDAESHKGEEGVNMAAAARLARCDQRTAKRGYERGWSAKGMLPIRSLLIREHMEARARLQQEARAQAERAENERQAARAQAVQARVQEGQMVTVARATSLQALALANHLLTGGRALAAQVKDALEAEAKRPPGERMALGPALTLLGRVAAAGESINRAAHQAMVMERLHLGRPTEVIAMVDADDLSLDDARARLAAATAAIANAERAHAAEADDALGALGETLQHEA